MRRQFLCLFIAATAAFATASASDITSVRAQSLAKAQMSKSFPSVDTGSATVTPVENNGSLCYYVVQYEQGGWVLVSADDNCGPVLAFSDEGRYVIEGQPENMRGVMNTICKEIRYCKAAAVSVGGKSVMSANRTLASSSSSDVEPLISVKWNQSSPYNKYCPSDNINGQAIVGCVAVAMAQAMSVQQYPARPTGEYSYNCEMYGNLYINYDKEDAYNWSNILSGANSKDDVAKLLYHCGVSVNMGYTPTGSGTQDKYIASALKRNFSYPNSVTYYARDSYSGDWEELIMNELNNGRAVCLSGYDATGGYGHCFNIDGYSANSGTYHVNWGWGGSNNGYFQLNGLKDLTMNMDYSDPSYQSVIVGIRPPSEYPSNIILSNTSVTEGMPASTVVGDVTVESEATNPTYTYTIEGEYNIRTHRKNAVPFTIVDGQLVTTETLSSETYGSTITVTITATNTTNGHSISRTFTIKVISSAAINELPVESAEAAEYYTVSGIRLDVPQKGVNVVKYKFANGMVKSQTLVVE